MLQKGDIWSLFTKTGNIDLYLLYRQYEQVINQQKIGNDKYDTTEGEKIFLR